MSSNYEHTTKFKADISSLKQGITQANKELKKIASEYKATSSAAELSGKEQDKLKAKFDYLTKALEQQNKKLQSYKDQLKVTQDYTKKLGDKEQELTKKLEDAKNKFGANSTEVQKYQKELTAVQKEITSNKDKIDKLNVTINNQQAICNNTEKELNDYTKALQDLQDSSQLANQGADDLGEGLGGISDAVTAASSALDSLGGIVDGLTDKFQNLLINGVKAVAEGVKSLATNAFESGITFESAMSQVVATMGLEKASEDYEKLSEVAKKYGAETKFTATQAAEALNYLALAGYKTNDAIELLPTVLDLAIAGGMDLGSASDMVTDAMSALGLEMDEAVRFTDELARTAQNSNTSVSQLGNAILTIGATARGMENGTAELSTALGVLANSSYKGEEGGTKLRNILLALQGPTEDAAALMDELGIKIYDAGKMRGINDIFEDLRKSMDGFSDEEINNVMNTLFNVRDVGAAKYMLSACGKEFDELFTKVSSCDGAASDMATTMSDNLEGSMYGLESAIEGLGIAFYDKLQTPARSVIDSITLTIRNLINEITNGEGLSGALDIISNSMTGFAESLPGLVEKHLPTLQQCFLGISQIIATLIDYLPYLIDTCLPKLLDIINKVLSGMPDFMENTLPKIIDLIGWVIENLPTLLTILYGIKGILAILKTVLAALGIGALISKLGALFGVGGVLASVGSVVGGVISTLGSFGGAILTLIGHTAVVIAFFEGIYAICLKIVGFFTGKNIKYENPIERLKKSFEGFSLEGIKSKFDELGTKIQDFVNSIPAKIEEFKNNTIEKFKEMGDNISTKFEEIGNKVVEFFENLPEKVAYWLGYMLGQIGAFFVNACNNFITWKDDTLNKIDEFINSIPERWENFKKLCDTKLKEFKTSFKEKWNQFWEDLGNKWDEFVESIPQKWENLKTICKQKWDEFYNSLKEKWNTFEDNTETKIDELVNKFESIDLKEIGKNIIDGLVNGLKDKWQDVKDTVGSFVSGIKDGFTSGLDIHSPSRWMKNFIGKNIVEGLELGITTNEGSLFNTLKDLNDGIKSSFNLDNVQLGLATATGSINSSGSSNIVNNSTSSNVNYNPVFNYNKPLNSKEIYRQNKNMLSSVLNK